MFLPGICLLIATHMHAQQPDSLSFFKLLNPIERSFYAGIEYAELMQRNFTKLGRDNYT